MIFLLVVSPCLKHTPFVKKLLGLRSFQTSKGSFWIVWFQCLISIVSPLFTMPSFLRCSMIVWIPKPQKGVCQILFFLLYSYMSWVTLENNWACLTDLVWFCSSAASRLWELRFFFTSVQIELYTSLMDLGFKETGEHAQGLWVHILGPNTSAVRPRFFNVPTNCTSLNMIFSSYVEENCVSCLNC